MSSEEKEWSVFVLSEEPFCLNRAMAIVVFKVVKVKVIAKGLKVKDKIKMITKMNRVVKIKVIA